MVVTKESNMQDRKPGGMSRRTAALLAWSLWAAAPLIGFSAQLDAGVGLPAVMTMEYL